MKNTNIFITELKENTFSDITFDRIWIKNCSKLKTIHRNAFNTTDSVTNYVRIENNPLLTSPDNSIFEILSKFVLAHEIDLFYNNITEIPSNAFKNIVGEQDELKILFLQGKSIHNLRNNAFSSLKSLEFLDISYTSIDFIPEIAFEFNEESEQQLIISLFANRYLKSSELSEYSFTNLRRLTLINLIGYYIVIKF